MSSLDKKTGYWRSLDEFEGDPQLQETLQSEFPAQAAELSDPFSRRRFMQLMGASMAFAGVTATGCRRWEREEIVPMSERPDDWVPGATMSYATAMELGGFAQGLVVTTYDGRPIKIEGNDRDAISQGKSTAYSQASILGMYDPDRSLTVRQKGQESTWDAAQTALAGLQLGDGTGLRILSQATGSPTIAGLRQEILRKYPRASWHEWEPLSTDNERLGLQMAYGRPLRAVHNLSRTQRIVAIDSDFLVHHPNALKHAREYAGKRNPEQNANTNTMMRLYAIESTFSNTGALADERLPLPSSEIAGFVADLEKALAGTAPAKDTARGRFLARMVEDLQQRHNQNRVVFIAGHRQPPEVHAAVARINEHFRAVSARTVQYLPLPEGNIASTHVESIKTLAADMNGGAVTTLLILGGNPAYDAPADVDFAAGLQRVQTSVHVSEYFDETSALCSWHLPRAHYLESWADGRGYDGTVYMTQPMIEPLTPPGSKWKQAGGKSTAEVLSVLTRGAFTAGQELLRESFDRQFARSANKERDWRRALHNGVVAATSYKPINPGKAKPGAPAAAASPPSRDNVEVVFTQSSSTYDGRFANNAWLQETPDFMSKLTWDNAALINPNTADELGISNGEVIEIAVGQRTTRVAAWTMPGQARYSIAVSLGYGRTAAGRVGGSKADGVGSVGFDVYKVRTTVALDVVSGARVRGLNKSHTLASTQDHWKMDDIGRDGIETRLGTLVREGTFAQYMDHRNKRGREAVVPGRRKDPHEDNFATKMGKEAGLHEVDLKPRVYGNNSSLWREHTYNRPKKGTRGPRYKWGMSIDLDKCTGCNSCMLACQAENNVPVVGKKQVINSREMHWIRIDRYFTGDDIRDNPKIAHQPMACQQCEMAPCEQVCPVGATVHSAEGLNDMVYNRCVGTRYCLNNCPFKVRRFNFTDYMNRDEMPGGSIKDARNKIRKLLFNPDVTVRSRGVMEKCTFCIQRIQNKKIAANNEDRPLRDGEIQTACQQACPSHAIEFGNLNDRSSRVAAAHRTQRSYAVLSELNLKNRNLFLAKIRNPYQPEPASEPAPKKPEQG